MNKSPCIISSYSTIPSFLRPPAGRAGKRGSSHSINANLIHYVTEQGDSRSSLRTVGNDGRGQGDSRSTLRSAPLVGNDGRGQGDSRSSLRYVGNDGTGLEIPDESCHPLRLTINLKKQSTYHYIKREQNHDRIKNNPAC
jgi:hypothetical protein